MKNYKTPQIRIGDKITYTYYKYAYKPDYNSQWEVVSTLDKSILIIERVENGVKERRMIDALDVKSIVH